MIHKIFSVYDEKARAFLPPFFLPETGQATRIFADCVNSPDHQFAKHPGDYSLFDLGAFDDSKGTLQPLEARNNLGNGVMFISPDEQPDLFKEEIDEKSLGDGTSIQSSTSGSNSP